MSDKVWKAQEIPRLCPPDITNEAEVYVKAIKNKIERILFLVERLSSSNTSIPRNFDPTVLRSSQLEVEIYIESIATNLHSLADVLAHIINVIVLKPIQNESNYLNSKKVSIYTVKTKLSNLNSLDSVREQYITEIINKINELIDSSEFKYIAAFVNTIKHRRLLDTELTVTVQNGSLIDRGYRLDHFEYQENCYLQTQCRVVAMDDREKVIDLVFDVGNSINNYCRAVFLMSA
jgi:hypothetical protein